MIKFQAKHKSGFTVDVLEPFTFPAGEAHIKGFESLNLDDYEYFIADVRGHDPQDLFHLNMWASGLDELVATGDPNYPVKYVILPYIPGARADRGAPFGAKVYASFFNSMFLDNIIMLDPHSEVAPLLYENGEKFPAANVIEFPFERIIKREIQDATSDVRPQIYNGVIAPDKGAQGRAARAAKVMGVPVYTAGKTRDFETGKLAGFHMEDELPATGKFLIVDDICDGGGTFVGLAAVIKKTNPNVKLDLWVTHGVFSQGFDWLEEAFDTIHTTNSYFGTVEKAVQGSKLTDSNIVVHDITPYFYGEITRLGANHV